jgi:hypothetical protein
MNPSASSQVRAEGRKSKVDALLLGAACWIPVIMLLLLFGFATIAWKQVGHWPHYGSPDPKDLNLPFLHLAAMLSLPVGMVSVLACLVVVIAAWSSLKWRDIVAYAFGAVAWIVSFPLIGSLGVWLID